MKKIDRLEAEARQSCESHHHQMQPFVVFKLHGGSAAVSDCYLCGMEVYLIERPAPNEIDVSGEAVALDCTFKEA